MTGGGPIYVVDTNILVDYVDILPQSTLAKRTS